MAADADGFNQAERDAIDAKIREAGSRQLDAWVDGVDSEAADAYMSSALIPSSKRAAVQRMAKLLFKQHAMGVVQSAGYVGSDANRRMFQVIKTNNAGPADAKVAGGMRMGELKKDDGGPGSGYQPLAREFIAQTRIDTGEAQGVTAAVFDAGKGTRRIAEANADKVRGWGPGTQWSNEHGAEAAKLFYDYLKGNIKYKRLPGAGGIADGPLSAPEQDAGARAGTAEHDQAKQAWDRILRDQEQEAIMVSLMHQRVERFVLTLQRNDVRYKLVKRESELTVGPVAGGTKSTAKWDTFVLERDGVLLSRGGKLKSFTTRAKQLEFLARADPYRAHFLVSVTQVGVSMVTTALSMLGIWAGANAGDRKRASNLTHWLVDDADAAVLRDVTLMLHTRTSLATGKGWKKDATYRMNDMALAAARIQVARVLAKWRKEGRGVRVDVRKLRLEYEP